MGPLRKTPFFFTPCRCKKYNLHLLWCQIFFYTHAVFTFISIYLSINTTLWEVCAQCAAGRTARCRAHDRLAKLSILNGAKRTMNDGTERSHLSQLHLFRCWLHSVGQLIYG